MSIPKNTINLTGLKIGKWKVLEPGTTNRLNVLKWKCQCECGTISLVDRQSLLKNKSKSCGCLRKENKGPKIIDITNKKFGRWLVINQVQNVKKYPGSYWLCRCECGVEKVILGSSLRANETLSCGCLQIDLMKAKTGKNHPNYKHGEKTLERQAEKIAMMETSCKICGGTKKLCWDHDHKTGKYRGTLCNNCNRVLGLFHDSVEKFESAANYLRFSQGA